MSDGHTALEDALRTLPDSASELLEPVRSGTPVFPGKTARGVADMLKVDLPQFVRMFLDLASSYARPTISNYRVGAVAQGLPDESGWSSLYLGGNIEFAGDDLTVTIHAEQAATLNAWLHGERGLSAITISAPPCGHCRQFLSELTDADEILVMLGRPGEHQSEVRLGDLLPGAFGPKDMGFETAWMAETDDLQLEVRDLPADPLAEHALIAAQKSYAPYTRGYAGCAIGTSDGQTFVGRYAENAAYNPSVSALRCGIVAMRLEGGDLDLGTVERVVLVEAESDTSQLPEAQRLVASLFTNAELEYYLAARVE